MLQFADMLKGLDEHIQNVIKHFSLRFWSAPSGRVRVFEGLIMSMPYAWTFFRREKSFLPAGIRTPDHPARSLVTVPTELTRILRMRIRRL